MKTVKEKASSSFDALKGKFGYTNKMRAPKVLKVVVATGTGGITVPIIPGIKPITAKVQATVLPTIFHIDLPEELADEVEKCKDAAAVKQVGIEWCVKQSRELMKFGVPTLHYYSMGKSDPIYRIAKELF
jgi:methylenetetrahydrofolate reductase (NADPH)